MNFCGMKADAKLFIIDSQGDEAVMGLDLPKQLDVTLRPATKTIVKLTLVGNPGVPAPLLTQSDPWRAVFIVDCPLISAQDHATS